MEAKLKQQNSTTPAEETVGKARLPYTAPKLIAHGSVADITQGSGAGEWTDAAFPARTPVTDLTFS